MKFDTSRIEVEQLLPYARHIVRKKPSGADSSPGYELRAGEKVLLVVDNKYDDLVIQAFVRAIREIGAKVDVISWEPEPLREWEAHDEMVYFGLPYPWEPPLWVFDIVKGEKYDILIQGLGGPKSTLLPSSCRYQRIPYITPELLGSSATTFPDEVLKLIDIKTWEIIKKAKKVRVTDPEGTSLKFTWFDEYWDGQGLPYKPGHLLGHPWTVTSMSDCNGVMAGTSNHIGPYPYLKATITNNKITKLEGGGKFGNLWRQRLKANENIQYPGFPGPGIGWLFEIAIGTHPKVARPRKDLFTRVHFLWERLRSGVIHLGSGPIVPADLQRRYMEEGRPVGHYHVHLYFATYEIETKSGEKIKLIENGHLKTLDDPEVRRVAAKYGDPDQLLREDWIPAVPGISIPGNYWDYARDPIPWVEASAR